MKIHRGQADAPMELVIAVIILTMSLALAFYIMNNAAEAQCVSQLRAENEKLRLAMQDVSLGYAGTTRKIPYKMYSCGRNRVDAIRFVKYTGSQYCGDCPGHYGACWKIEPAIKTGDGTLAALRDANVCIDMSESLSLESASTSNPDCRELSDNPCPKDFSSCTPAISGVPSSVATASGNLWKTLGKEGSGVYEITLTKIAVAAAAQGQINICAKKLN